MQAERQRAGPQRFRTRCPIAGKAEGRAVRTGLVLVYALHMARTNVEIDEGVVERVMHRYGLRTKRAAIDLALRRLDLEPMTREDALAMRGTGWDGDLDELRGGYLPPSS